MGNKQLQLGTYIGAFRFGSYLATQFKPNPPEIQMFFSPVISGAESADGFGAVVVAPIISSLFAFSSSLLRSQKQNMHCWFGCIGGVQC